MQYLSNKERDEKIKELRKNKAKLREIAEQFQISPERVRQITTTILSYCGIHQRQYIKSCSICKYVAIFEEKLNKMRGLENGIQDEITRLSRRIRSKEVVLQRVMLVKKLKDEFGLSFSEIGKLLNRHRTSIMSLYGKNKTI